MTYILIKTTIMALNNAKSCALRVPTIKFQSKISMEYLATNGPLYTNYASKLPTKIKNSIKSCYFIIFYNYNSYQIHRTAKLSTSLYPICSSNLHSSHCIVHKIAIFLPNFNNVNSTFHAPNPVIHTQRSMLFKTYALLFLIYNFSIFPFFFFKKIKSKKSQKQQIEKRNQKNDSKKIKKNLFLQTGNVP